MQLSTSHLTTEHVFGPHLSLFSANGTALAIGVPGDGLMDEFSWSACGADIMGESNRDWFGSSMDLSSDGQTLAMCLWK